MSSFARSLVLVGCSLTLGLPALAAPELRVVSDDEDYHLRPIFEQFQKETGIKVRAAFVEEGDLAARVLTNRVEVDVLFTQDMSLLAQLKGKGVTAPIVGSTKLAAVPAHLKDKAGHFVGLAYRPRAIIYSKERLQPGKLTGYADLVSPRFKGRVCARSLDHTYNITLLSEMIVDRGEAKAAEFARKLADNLAMKSEGNDRKQALFISQNKCDLAPFNTYYYTLMRLDRGDLHEAALKTRILMPDQAGKGAYVLVTGGGVAKGAKNMKEAARLLDFMLGTFGQRFVAEKNHQYPVIWKGDLPATFNMLGEGQPGIKNGVAKLNWVDYEKMAAARETAAKILTREKARTGK